MGDEGQRRADVIIGDLDGASCSEDFRACIVDCLRATIEESAGAGVAQPAGADRSPRDAATH